MSLIIVLICSFVTLTILSAANGFAGITDLTFKEEVLELLREAARGTHVEVRFDMPAPIASHFTVDAYFSEKKPLAVIVAETRERLLQAEVHGAKVLPFHDFESQLKGKIAEQLNAPSSEDPTDS
jgi:hypothetical protein